MNLTHLSQLRYSVAGTICNLSILSTSPALHKFTLFLDFRAGDCIWAWVVFEIISNICAAALALSLLVSSCTIYQGHDIQAHDMHRTTNPLNSDWEAGAVMHVKTFQQHFLRCGDV